MHEMLYEGCTVKGKIEQSEELPIYMTTAYAINDTEDYCAACEGKKYYYNREGNPNRDALANVISSLEGNIESNDTIICSSGMSAIFTTLITLLKKEDKIVVNKSLYGETREILDGIMKRYGVEVIYADFSNIKELGKVAHDKITLFYTEVITNPLIEVVDIKAVADVAHKSGALLVVDSTFTTPLVVKPLEFGTDIVIHSLTKYFGGHGDLTGGSITAKCNVIKALKPLSILMGGCLGPNSSWLMLRSIRTMGLRVTKQNDNALIVARSLQRIESVKKVYYPGLEDHPQHALAKNIFKDKYGAMLSFRVEDNRQKIDSFIRKLHFIQYLGTLGGIRTSITHPATAFRNAFSDKELKKMGLEEGLVRISVGIENPQEIIDDLTQALSVFA